MSKTATLVFTTIFDAKVLFDYYNNFQKFDRLPQVKIVVIPDKKTPKSTFDYCSELAKKGLQIEIPDLVEQENFLSKVGFPEKMIPYNSDNRRNVGYLMALEHGSDFIMSIDDDNFCQIEEDFFEAHAVVCSEAVTGTQVESDTNWFNVCDLMELDKPGVTYPRGYPYYARHGQSNLKYSEVTTNVDINAGLWLESPDVDGISWLVNPMKSVAFKDESILLGKKTWSPINTQNTSLKRHAMPAYYFVKMNYPLGGQAIDRYGDIFSGYFVQACAKHLNADIRFGTPIALHKRNSHNYLQDAANEWACIVMLESLLPWLTNQCQLTGDNYLSAYLSLSEAMEEAVEEFEGKIWTDATRGYFHQMAFYMRQWIKSCQTIGV